MKTADFRPLATLPVNTPDIQHLPKQEQRVLRHLYATGSITPVEAMQEYGVMRLAAVIHRLKGRGYFITSKKENNRNRYREKVSFARYYLHEPNVQQGLFQ